MGRFWKRFREQKPWLKILEVEALIFMTVGVALAAGGKVSLDRTNTLEFCISCHEMRGNVYEEIQPTIHFTNRSGVRATCPDCHVPHDWTDKIARKMQASKEVWGKIFGTINTREKFVAKRLEHIPNSDPPRVRIISDNPLYKPYEGSGDEVNIIGRIRWFAREM